jgi:hypothetical protein
MLPPTGIERLRRRTGDRIDLIEGALLLKASLDIGFVE